jgi:hypothetical protein
MADGDSTRRRLRYGIMRTICTIFVRNCVPLPSLKLEPRRGSGP